ncbi:MAG: CotH kinase family protein [Lachnospiraceae bacterium]|nr:CotH kinase family protein [Lachnospiraceae bacterium]
MRKQFLSRITAYACAFTMLVSGSHFPMLATANAETNTISIDSADELAKIGNDAGYPLNGDYKLTADLDLGSRNWTPIGGGKGAYGATSGDHVFNGTFDGQGHVISNLKIDYTIPDNNEYEYGLFGIIGSADESDPASVSNLLILEPDVKISGGDHTGIGALAGEANGFVTVDNVAVVGGNVTTTGSLYNIGAAGLIGECRSKGLPDATNNAGIFVSNVFNSANVTATTNTNDANTSGIIGRATRSNVGSLENAVNIGTITQNGNLGYGILSDAWAKGNLSNCYTTKGNNQVGSATALAKADMGNGTLPEGLSSSLWSAEEDYVYAPKIAYSVPTAKALLASAELGISFDTNYAVVGSSITATLKSAPANSQYTFKWTRSNWDGSNATSIGTGTTYTPVAEDNEKFITATVESADPTINGIRRTLFCSSIPVVYINTTDGQDIRDKVNYKTATMTIATNDNKYLSTQLYDGDIEIRGRGNGSWTTGLQKGKLPYKVKLASKTDLFGMGSNKHWALVPNWYDSSLSRNVFTNGLAKSMGLETMNSVDVVVIFNGRYDGVYQFSEQVRLGSERLDIYDWESAAEDLAKAVIKAENAKGETYVAADQDELEESLAENLSWASTGTFTWDGKNFNVSDYPKVVLPAINGGFLWEIDMRYDEVSKWRSVGDKPCMFKSPEFAYTNEDMMNYSQNYVRAFETAIDAGDFTTEYTENGVTKNVHYSELFDIDTLAADLLLQEVILNWDGFKNSVYFYKDVNGIAKMGPAWDYDWSLSNRANSAGSLSRNIWLWADDRHMDGWNGNELNHSEHFTDTWYEHLVRDPYFAAKFYDAYKAARANYLKTENYTAFFDARKELLEDSAATNFTKYNNGYAFADDISHIKNYLSERLSFLGSNTTSLSTLIQSWGKYKASNKLSVSAVDTSVEGKVSATATVTDSNIKKVVFQIDGKKLAPVTVTNNAATATFSTDLVETDGSTNVVEVYACDESGNYIEENENVVTNYKDFTLFIAEPEKPTSLTDDLIINQVYGNGDKTDPAVSHSFVELYNPTNQTKSLNGYTLKYVSGDTTATLTLDATKSIPAKTSYLIRCNASTIATEGFTFRCTLANADQEWAQVFSNKNLQLTLYKGEEIADQVAVDEETIEGTALSGALSKQKAIVRKDYQDTNDNSADFISISYKDLKDDEIAKYRPRCLNGSTEPTVSPQPSTLPSTQPSASPTTQPSASPTVKPTSAPSPTVKPTVTPAPAKVTAPKKVTGLTIKRVKNKKVYLRKLSWKKVSGAKGYEIFRATKNKASAFKKIKTQTSVKYTDKKAKKKTAYFYKVRAYKLNGKTKVYGAFSKVTKK